MKVESSHQELFLENKGIRKASLKICDVSYNLYAFIYIYIYKS